MKITYEQYTKRYYFNEVKPMTFAELETFKEELQAIVTDVYQEQLAELDLGGESGCESGGCVI